MSAAPERLEDAPDLPEVSVRTTAPLLLQFEQKHGAARLEQLWAQHRFALSIEYLRNPTNFVSLRFLEQLAEALTEASGNRAFMREAGLSLASRDGLGAVYYILRAFGSPKFCYEQTLQISRSYNRVGAFRVEALERDRLELEYRSSKPERNRNICELRMGQFASFPTIWGLPPAVVEETRCQAEGADSCHYRLRWTNPVSNVRIPLGALVGALLGVAIAALGHAAAPVVVPLGLAVGALAGAWATARKELATKDASLQSQNRALGQTLSELEERYQELRLAKVELERRVEDRTRQLTERTAELAEANGKLEQSLSQQQELDRLKTEFFANVNHELRTPLTLMLLSVEGLARRDDLSPEVRRYVDGLERSGARLLRLINTLLELSKVEAGKARLRYEKTELFGFLGMLALPFRLAGEGRGVKVLVEGEPGEPLVIDPEKTEIVFQNLLSNALKFSPDGGTVRVSVRRTETEVAVEIADQGPGIAEEDQARIFDRFAQADTKGIRRLGGSGIGLALVKELVELHGGRIEVSSVVGGGSRFTVRLPLGEAHVREELRERRSVAVPVAKDRRGASVTSIELSSPRPLAAEELPAPVELPEGAATVLVVEDEADLRSFLVHILSPRYRVLTASNGEEGLALAVSKQPALVLSDLMMPRMSGEQLLRALRADRRTLDVPVILLTATGSPEGAARGLREGANDYLAKPFSPRELLARVEAQLRIRDAAARSAEYARLSTLGLVSSGFAHEIRNPLNGLLNALPPLEELLTAQQADDARELVSMAAECAERIHGISEQLLGLARQGGAKERFELGEALASSLELLRFKVPQGVQVHRRFEASVTLEGDRGALNQVWVNLIDNAIHAVGPEGEITLSIAPTPGGGVEVGIADDGVGIAPEVLPRVFEPFFSTREPGVGTGLGLTLSRRIVAEHGGTLRLESAPGKGTRASVQLPRVLAGEARASGGFSAASSPGV